MTTLAVVYDKGAVSAGDIAVGLADLGTVTFLVAPSEHTARMRPVFDQLGASVLLTGDLDADAARLRALAPDAILTFSEPMLRTTAALAGTVGLPFHDVATARLLTDKVRQRARLREAGVDDVRSHPVRGVADWPAARAAVGLPAVLKPVRGEGSRHTHVVTDDVSAERVLRAVSDGPGVEMIAEELLRGAPGLPFGDYVAVESLCGPDGISHLAVTGKFPLLPPFREVGQFWPATVSPPERAAILDLVGRALRALGVTRGLTHTEVKLTATGPRIIEVNGRLGGHVNELARRACGVDLIRVAGQLALGGPVDVPALEPDAVHFVRYSLAPTAACRLVGVHGARTVRGLPGVTGYRSYARAGDHLAGGVMTNHMDLLWGECADHDAMTATVREALSHLAYDFEFADGARRLTGLDLLTHGTADLHVPTDGTGS